LAIKAEFYAVIQFPSFKRTRIAPTPSGFLHIGNAFSFLLTAALAKRTGARIFLRIDDLDRDRVETAYVEDVFDTLNFLGIEWEEGPRDLAEYEKNFSQLLRLPLYNEYLEKLREGGHLFACTCSRAQLKEGVYPGTCKDKKISFDSPGVCWRVDTSRKKTILVKTLDEGLKSVTLPAEMNYFVARKKDGFPAYQLCSFADDLYFDVDLVVRGSDLWPSTIAQLYLASLLNERSFSDIVFYHHPLLKEGNDKLSKSAGSLSLKHYREQGKEMKDVSELITDFMGGFEPGKKEEIMLILKA
jgi:glutamyl/glutaminyl-tRNA synthetase